MSISIPCGELLHDPLTLRKREEKQEAQRLSGDSPLCQHNCLGWFSLGPSSEVWEGLRPWGRREGARPWEGTVWCAKADAGPVLASVTAAVGDCIWDVAYVPAGWWSRDI